jgi:hypothetical protein
VMRSVVDARHPDPIYRLEALRELRSTLEAWERDEALAARAEGESWEAIGRVMGLRRQAVWKRYREAWEAIDGRDSGQAGPSTA